jgi:dCMP deaminase
MTEPERAPEVWGNGCECWVTPEHLWTTHYGAVEPGSQLEFNPECPKHGEPRRPEWDEWGLKLAAAVATRADCTRRKVGAVIMTPDHTIISQGYNGAPAGEPGCLTAGACPRGRMSSEDVAPGSSYDTGAGSCIAVHAEGNALLRATWSLLDGATIYCTEEPCDGCLRLIRGTPMARIVSPSGVVALKP